MEESTGIKLIKEMKIAVATNSFDLCGNTPKEYMDIYVSSDGRLSCNSLNSIYHIIGNMRTNYDDTQSHKYYTIYIVNIK